MEYRQSVIEKGIREKTMYDWWNGELYKTLVSQRDLFTADTDLGFFFSTDGVKVFKSCEFFSSWPMMLINFSLPPDERYKLENLLFLGHIPGPDQPKDVDSFLEPLIAEFEVLQHGITTYNTLQDEEFLLRAHIITVGADSHSREKVLHNTGIGSY